MTCTLGLKGDVCPNRTMLLNTQFLAGGAKWGGCGTFLKWAYGEEGSFWPDLIDYGRNVLLIIINF